ncbi:MAG: hypothetical protein ACO1RT_05390 [Planctomycetaceae bacterium]
MRRPRSRHGFLYLSVLVTSLIVVATATTAFSISSYRMRSRQSKHESLAALRAAESELHRIASILSGTDLSWRNNLVSGAVSGWQARDEGAQVASRLVDADTDLADDPSDLVELTCYATIGRARRGAACTLQPVTKPLPILDFALVSTGSINVTATRALACTGKIRCGSSVTFLTGGSAAAKQWNATSAIAPAVRGEVIAATGQSLAIPSSTIATAYTAIGTQIPAGSLPLVNGARQLRKSLLTPSVNPFGMANASGVYWIDAGGLPVMISECRIEATLAIINCSQVTLTRGNYWKAPLAGGVALLTTAAIRVDQSEALMIESSMGFNLNPAAAPFRAVSDNDTNDRYHSSIEGLIYTPGVFEWTAMNPAYGMLLRGTIVCGGASIAGPMSLQEDTSSRLHPPLGFRLYDQMEFVRGSWRTVPVPAS